MDSALSFSAVSNFSANSDKYPSNWIKTFSRDLFIALCHRSFLGVFSIKPARELIIRDSFSLCCGLLASSPISLKEMTKSMTAQRRGINNTPGAVEIKAMGDLSNEVLEH